jgi:hypothetical protein
MAILLVIAALLVPSLAEKPNILFLLLDDVGFND